ncbi:MAG TPA: DDE-type integrase/transposase/recombinase [Candidatus Obscuribacterales bacterium]
MDEEKRLNWARFRFSVIAPLVCRKLTEEQRRALRHEILSQTFLDPDGHERRVASRTLNEWVARHRDGGFDGLHDCRRNTLGTSRAIPDNLLDRAEQLRREEETRSVKMILRLLDAEGYDVGQVSKSTLNVHLNQRGAGKARLSGDKGSYQRWQQKWANKLWQADTSAGLWLPDPKNPKAIKQTRLISFIDDATRVCTHAEFYWDEQLPSLVDCFRKALLKRGKPEKLLCDNAFIYHSKTIEIMCAHLDIEIKFCKPYSAPTKGKIEKHYGTIKGGFYKEAEHSGLTSLDELNQFFFAWLTKEYHHSDHSELGTTPIKRWQQDENIISRVTPEDIRRALMLRATRKVNGRTALIRLDNNAYQVSPELAGTTVEVRWDVRNYNSVEVWRDGKLLETAPLTTAQPNIDFSRKPQKKEKPRGITYESSKRYRHALIAAHRSEKPIPQPPDEYLSENEFVDMVAAALAKQIEPEELRFLSHFFVENAPLRTTFTKSLLDQIVNAKGNQLPLRSYLEHIRVATFKIRR